jgi:hypothetical protein
MGEETVRVDPNEDLDMLIARLKQSRSKDVVLELPTKQRALQTLDNFYALRKAAREDGLTLTFSGGNKTLRGLAKLLGFGVRGTEDGDESEIADFGGGSATEQITMPPAQQRTMAFDGPPQGFVQQTASAPPRNGNGNGRGEAVPPPITSAEDFFSSLQDMDIPSIQPPPARNDNGFGMGGGDQVLNRNNAANVFGLPGGAAAVPPPASPPPRAEFDFSGGGSGEGSTLSYEEAMRQGFLADNPPNLSNDFQFDAPTEPPPLMDDDDVPPVPPVGGDNAAAQFRRGGRRGEEEFDEPVSRGRPARGGRAPNARPARAPRSGGRGLVMPAALTGLGTRVNKILNPVERTNSGGMMRSELSPAQREQRRRQSQRTTFFAFIALAVLLIAVVLIIVLSLNSGNNGATGGPGIGGPVATTRLNLVYKTQPVNNNVTLLLDTSATAGTSGTAGQTNPAGGGNAAAGAGTGGRLPVSQISTGAVTAKSDYPAFGSKMQPTGTAQGNVTFINAAAAPVGYGAGTVLFTASNGVTYRLRDGISIPAGNPLGGTQGRAGGVVVADRAGSIGNLPNGFSRYLSSTVAVVTNGAVTGGTEQAVKVVSPADIDGLKKMLIEKAQTDAQNSLQGKYNPATEDIVVVPGGDPQCTTTKQAGEVADTFSGSCTINPQVYRYSKTDLQKAVQNQLVTDPNLRLDPGSVKIGGGANVKNENGRVTLQVPVSGQAYTPVDLDKLKQDLANKTVTEAQTLLSTSYPGIDRIDFSSVQGGKLPDATKIEFVTTPGGDVTTTSGGAIATPAGTTTAGASGAAPTLGGGVVLPTATPKA